MHIVRAVSKNERPPRLDDPPLSDDAWRLIHQCWAHEKWKRPGIRDVVKIMKSWRIPQGMSPTATFPQSPGSATSGSSHLGHKLSGRSHKSDSTNRHSNSGGSSSGASPGPGQQQRSASVNTRQSRASGSNYHNGNTADIPETFPLPFRLAPARPNEGKMSVSIDFGTTFSGVAYGSTRATGGKVRQILNWPGHMETFRKAKNTNPLPEGTMRCEWFKLYLEPKTLRDRTADPRLPRLPPGKEAIDVITDFLYCLWQYAKGQITKEVGAVADLDTAEIWLAVPAVWDAKGCDIMRQAAINAGLVHSVKAGDVAWRDRLHIITEPEAAAVHCAFLTDVHRLAPSQNFMIVDAGGGTCDLAMIGLMTELEIAEMCARSGANCGSIFLDLRFRELVKFLLSDHPAHLDRASLASFVLSFSESDKLDYRGRADDDLTFHFNCFNAMDPDDRAIGLIGGQLHIRGSLLRENVFDPVVNQQLNKVEEPIHALLLVGGFAGSEYLKQRVEETFSSKIKIIDTATLRGAAQYGLSKRQAGVKLPAEDEDRMKRPAYLEKNDAGKTICQNRKGQRSTAKFCKYSQNSLDSIFVTTIYANESDTVMRYTDQGQTTEVCKWTYGGFYTEFELGLELDNVEVRGVLVYQDKPLESIALDFF
ncbi:hypothetical protein F5887DRAFT_980246 [Amanita rubescens]|nr:hypothetical protein F5887DRAFT_980246 [Amanita rubescens]